MQLDSFCEIVTPVLIGTIEKIDSATVLMVKAIDWCGWRDLNPHDFSQGPKPCVSTISPHPQDNFIISGSNLRRQKTAN